MPRIDPLQLLNCLSVLLRPDGGIRSESEVLRLASLMTKFSKKLVSKCIYVQILKRSDTRLLELFMSSGGWSLIHMWLSDGILNKNWALVQELLELLLLSPVDVEILKSNNCPKLVKGLSRDESQEGVRLLAGKLVEQWLRLVKGESVKPVETPAISDQSLVSDRIPDCSKVADSSSIQQNKEIDIVVDSKDNSTIVTEQPIGDPRAKIDESKVEKTDVIDKVLNNVASEEEQKSIIVNKVHDVEPVTCLKPVTSTINENVSDVDSSSKDTIVVPKESVKKEKKEKHSSSNSSHKSSPKSSSSKYSSSKSLSSSSNHHRSKDKERDKRSSSSKSSSRDKDKDRDKEKDRDREKEKEKARSKQEEKDKATLDKLKPKTLSKLGKIPKKTVSSNDDKGKSEEKSSKNDKSSKTDEKLNKVESKKPSISIEVRKNEGSRPKTVKTFNSKFRSHGLEEEAKPPPPRPLKKSSSGALPVISAPVKRSSPTPRYDNMAPPEKAAKLAESPVQAKPGAIKLIPAKPKPSMLMESDMFMDALSASASSKKEPRKRKRKLSTSKDVELDLHSPGINAPSPLRNPKLEEPADANSSSKIQNNNKPASDVDIPAPPRFYQDTLENTDEEKDTETEKEIDQSVDEQNHEIASPNNSETGKDGSADNTSNSENSSKESAPLKGVLLTSKRKGPKKKLQWRAEEELVDIQYFELDETERVNVTKTFTDMKQMERVNEREAFQLARKLPNEDTMEERTSWMILIPIDGVAPINFGKNSREKDVQYARERTVAPAMYYHRMMIPESPAEPDPELYSVSDPTIIPLDDVTGNPDTVNDFQNTPWPEPKGLAPAPVVTAPVAPFASVPPMMPFGPHGPGMGFSMPPFPGHMGPPPFPTRPNNDSMPPMNPDMMMNGGGGGGGGGGMFPPHMDGPSDGGMIPMNNFGPPFVPPFSGHNPPGGFPGNRAMRPMNNMGGGNMGGPRGPPPLNSGWYRAPGSRGPMGPPPGGLGPTWQNGPRKNWNPRVCKQFFRKGFCNKGDNCQFLHPGVNCPPL